MKHVFRWIGWALFAFISIILLVEYSGISSYDTCLFWLGGQSVGLQSLDNAIDLSPIVMALVYFSMLAINIIAVVYKKDFIALCFTNSILSIPIMLVLHHEISYYPPFGNTECFVIPTFLFLIFSYLSAVLLFLFIGYTLIKSTRHER